jgi:hypothetical protein
MDDALNDVEMKTTKNQFDEKDENEKFLQP